MFRILFILFCFSLISLSCNEASSNQEKAETEKEAPAAEANFVVLSPEELKHAALRTGRPELMEMRRVLRVSGTVEAAPQNRISVSMPLGGYVRSMQLVPGQAVRKGALLARMEDQQYIQLQQDYLMGRSRLRFLEADLARQKGLNETQAVSDKVVQGVRSEWESQRVLVQSLQEKLRLIGIDPARLHAGNISRSVGIYAPADGFVSKVHVNPGKYVTGTDVLFELVNPANMHLALTVFEKDMPGLSVGQRVQFYANGNPVKRYMGKVVLVSRDIGEDRTSEVHCHIEQADRDLMPGMFVNAEVELSGAVQPAVPEEAVVRWENRHYVFLAEGANRFVLTPVEPGHSQDGYTSLRSPLPQSEVVLQNAYTLLMKLKNSGEE